MCVSVIVINVAITMLTLSNLFKIRPPLLKTSLERLRFFRSYMRSETRFCPQKSSWTTTRTAAANSRKSSKYVASLSFDMFCLLKRDTETILCIFLGKKCYSREATGAASEGRNEN